MQKFIIRTLATLSLACTPALALSATVSTPRDFRGLVDLLVGIMEKLVLLIFALTFLAIIWSVVKGWVIHGGDAEEIKGGKDVVFVGIIVLVVMSSIWGILALLRASLFGG